VLNPADTGSKASKKLFWDLLVNHLKKIYLQRSMFRFRTIFFAFKKKTIFKGLKLYTIINFGWLSLNFTNNILHKP